MPPLSRVFSVADSGLHIFTPVRKSLVLTPREEKKKLLRWLLWGFGSRQVAPL